MSAACVSAESTCCSWHRHVRRLRKPATQSSPFLLLHSSSHVRSSKHAPIPWQANSRREVAARAKQQQQQQEEEFVDTRIHWDDPNEGWIEGDASPRSTRGSGLGARSPGIWPISRDLVMAIMEVESSHYRVLGVTPTDDMDSVKSAYRRLSKLYHPDTTELPLELAEQKFVQLREAYSVLSSAEQRRLYDWKIASESSQKKGQRFVWPYEVDASQRGYGSRNSPPLKPREESKVDENGNVPFSDSSMAALTFDVFAVVLSIIVIVGSTYLKNQ